jgi:hypothetical protein
VFDDGRRFRHTSLIADNPRSFFMPNRSDRKYDLAMLKLKLETNVVELFEIHLQIEWA